MPAEQIKNYEAPNNILETLNKKHDQLAGEAAGLEYEANELRKNLKNICEKDFLLGDKKKEKEIDLEKIDIIERLAGNEAELKEIWRKINDIQAELLEAEKK